MEEFTEEEVRHLKQLAENMEAWGRVGTSVRVGLLWLSGIIVSGLIIWDFVKGFFSK